MRETTVRAWCGLGMVFAHVAVSVVLFLFYLRGGFSFSELTTSLGILSPMFMAYTGIIVPYFARNRYLRSAPSGRSLNVPFVILTFTIPALFLAGLLGATYLKAYNLAFSTFEEYKATLLVVESVIGVYLGPLVRPLFGAK